MRSRIACILGVTLLAVAVSGCFDPYRAHVDPATLGATTLHWQADERAQKDNGPGGAKTIETDYTVGGGGSGAAYPAILQVLSVRGLATVSNAELLRITHDAVDNATRSASIRIDSAASQSGTRTLANGLATQFFVEEGTVTNAGLLFSTNAKVRIIGEVGHDGRSSTSIVAIGIAQVDSSTTATACPLPLGCESGRSDLRSWNEMVGDPAGTVTSATTNTGLIHHLVTHA